MLLAYWNTDINYHIRSLFFLTRFWYFGLNPFERRHIPSCLLCTSRWLRCVLVGQCSETAKQKLRAHFITACCVCAWRRHALSITETIWHRFHGMLPCRLIWWMSVVTALTCLCANICSDMPSWHLAVDTWTSLLTDIDLFEVTLKAVCDATLGEMEGLKGWCYKEIGVGYGRMTQGRRDGWMREEQSAGSVLLEWYRCKTSFLQNTEAPASLECTHADVHYIHKYVWQACCVFSCWPVLICYPLRPLLQSGKAHERGNKR